MTGNPPTQAPHIPAATTATPLPLLPTPTSPPFCEDDRITSLFKLFGKALLVKDGDLLASLVHPENGLSIFFQREEVEVTLTRAEVRDIFGSSQTKFWGTQPGSGLPQQGTFSDIVLPKLQDVFQAEYTEHCNVLATGGTTYSPALPPAFANSQYYSLYRLAPAGMDMDWRTWVAVIDYYQGKPFIRALIKYDWEI
ncbi:MAG TPA: hypothetical protein PKW33_12640 [Anaerolineaceae bacterium]|nr:hypothetical protein [Anaerolineaceae bacterium]HPN52430.1 hypothetical protein [Anaerolineaceae bacterium]